MISIENDDIRTHSALYFEAMSKASGAPFLEDDYLKKVVPTLSKNCNNQYPKKILIPKSLDRLKKGDFEPERIITITEPIQGPYSEIWFNDSSNGVKLRSGYINGDSRFVTQQEIGDNNVHMFLGGATGQGKSVTLNAMIFGMCVEYAPWDVCLTMCDAKITEFKTYALETPLPHIETIAATGDIEYLVSVLEDIVELMNAYNAFFPKSGTKNIKDFRKKTGLALPRHLIVIDECTAMFKFAGKNLTRILTALDALARLGRATGFHLILASQEVSSDIPESVLANIKLRAAMGCTEGVSNKILGNSAASLNYGRKGKMIMSEDTSKKENNVNICVPYMPDNQRVQLGKGLIERGDDFKFKYNLSFYDEEDLMYEEDYEEYLKKLPEGNVIYLGEPSYLMHDALKVVKLNLTAEEIENICVLVSTNAHMERYFKMLKCNIDRIKNHTNIVLCAESLFVRNCNANKLASGVLYSEEKIYKDNFIFNVIHMTVYKRKVMLEADNLAFSPEKYNPVLEEEFHKQFKRGSDLDTDTNKRRFYFTYSVLQKDIYQKIFGFDAIPNKAQKQEKMIKISLGIINLFVDYGFKDSKISHTDMPPVFAWILGVNKIIGLGRDSSSRNVMELKKVMQDSSEVNVRFILFTTTLEDINELMNGIRWVISDDIPQKEITKMKASDYYPSTKATSLGVLFDQFAADIKLKCVKFKKILLKDEV